ncbi:MAG TPA: hypothetical protein VEN12_12540 [Verrucomicrobiae bacterium]|nr:hypothetical protein [Verrucomicrobiae bacterium]
MSLALPARAKLNLDLEVVGRNRDGFHDLRTTFQAIDLHDLLEIERADQTTMTASGFEIDESSNSVLDAQHALQSACGRELPARVHIEKRIPPGSGMGGASSDAAAMLKALKTTYRLDVDLMPIARELGADVPFFLVGGRAHAEGRGDRLTRLPHEPAWFAVAWSGIELSTAAVYGAWDQVKGEGPNHLRRAAEHVEPRLKQFAESLGPGWQMTGSGSAFFKRAGTEEAAGNAAAKLVGWSAVTRAVSEWT